MTISGSTVYEKIKAQLSAAQAAYNGVSAELTEPSRQVSALTQERDDLYLKLATVYLPELSDAAVRQTADGVRQQISTMLTSNKRQLGEIAERMEHSQEQRGELVSSLEQVTGDLERTAVERDQVLADIATELSADVAYLSLRGRANALDAQLGDNRTRYASFEAEAAEKRAAYEESSLFQYLLGRKFGTPEYTYLYPSATGFTRRLDRGVARLINFPEAKRNYDYLCAIPEAMAAKIEARGEELDGIVAQIAPVERATENRHGLPPIVARGERLAAERQERIDGIEQEDARYRQFTAEQQELSNPKGPAYRSAHGELLRMLQGKTVADLVQIARSTPDRTDDALVDRLVAIEETLPALEGTISALKRRQGELTAPLTAFRELQTRYDRDDFESSRSYFPSTFNIATLLDSLNSGQRSFEYVWSQIKSAQQFKAPEPTYHTPYTPSYSTSSPRNSTPTRSSPSRSPSRPSGGGLGGGFGGGSRSSGGGFGGGSRSTGGGFGRR